MGIMRRALDLLFPRGPLWHFTGDAVLLFDSIALALDAVKDKIDQARAESIPATALDTLPEWHSTLGIAYDQTLPLERQRNMLTAILTADGTATRDGLAYQIAKEYPGLSVGENSGSEIPDDPAGVTYLQDDWFTVDGWNSDGSATVTAPGGGVLRGVAIGSGYNVRKASISYPAGTYTVRVKAKITVGGLTSYRPYLFTSAPIYASSAIPFLVIGEYVIFDCTIVAPATITQIGINRTAGAALDTIEIDFIYIGTGAYLPNRYNISGTVDRIQDARRVGAIAAHFAPLHLVPTVLGFTAPTAGNPNPVPPVPSSGTSIISVSAVARAAVASLGLARCGKAS